MPDYRVFIVEDDPIISDAIARHIEGWGLSALRARDFKSVAREAREAAPQLILMDITLPFFNGYYWCAEIRKFSNVPIIFVSSASESMDIVMAMNMGGDDFIVKPFDLDVLTAKIQAILRRAYDFGAPELVCCGARLNLSDASLVCPSGRVELTKNEYRVLQTLFEKKGRVVSRETLMEKLWETDSFIDENTLNVNVARLRKKLSEAGLHDFIKTRKGLGYIIGASDVEIP